MSYARKRSLRAGSGWTDERSDVAVIYAPAIDATGAPIVPYNYIPWGTATLVTNACGYRVPYILTARHIIRRWKGTDFSSWKFYFNYYSSTCTPTTYPTLASLPVVQGATLKSYSDANADFALLQLSAFPSTSVVPAGFTTSTTTPTSIASLYHPNGDVMDILTSTSLTTSGIYWVAASETSQTEGGASGAAMFDQNHHIMGQLYGGYPDCSGSDEFGKFNLSWTGDGTSGTRLRDWLDPYNASQYTNIFPTFTVDKISYASMVADQSLNSRSITATTTFITPAAPGSFNISGTTFPRTITWSSNSPYVTFASPHALPAVPTVTAGVSGDVTIYATAGTCIVYTKTVSLGTPSPSCTYVAYVSAPVAGVKMIVSTPGATTYRWYLGSYTGTPISGATNSQYIYPYATLCPNNGGGIYFDGDVVFYVQAYTAAGGWSTPTQIFYHFNCSTNTMTNESCQPVCTTCGDPRVASEEEQPMQGVNVYPNPADGKIYIEVAPDMNFATAIRLTDLSGKQLAEKSIPVAESRAVIESSGLNGGMYLVTIEKGAVKITKKVLVRH